MCWYRITCCHTNLQLILDSFFFLLLFIFFNPPTSISGSTEDYTEALVGDVITHQLHNLKPGTTYDLEVLAQYDKGFSKPLDGEGTTCKRESSVCSLCSTTPVEGEGVVRVTFPLSVPERDGPDHLQRGPRLLLRPMDPSQGGHLLQSQSQSCGP